MATASKFLLTPEISGCFRVDGMISKDSAVKASELLQKNQDDTDIFFNEDRFHSKLFAPLGMWDFSSCCSKEIGKIMADNMQSPILLVLEDTSMNKLDVLQRSVS